MRRTRKTTSSWVLRMRSSISATTPTRNRKTDRPMKKAEAKPAHLCGKRPPECSFHQSKKPPNPNPVRKPAPAM
jgi:hypothetical protein